MSKLNPEKIRLIEAQVVDIHTRADGSFRVVLELPETSRSIMSVAMLLEVRLAGALLHLEGEAKRPHDGANLTVRDTRGEGER